MHSSKKIAVQESLPHDLTSFLNHYLYLSSGQSGMGDILLGFLTFSDLQSFKLTQKAFQHPSTLTMLKQFALHPNIAGRTVLAEGYVSYVQDSKEIAREKITREIHYPNRQTSLDIISDKETDIQNKIAKMQDLLRVAVQCDLNNKLSEESFEELLSEPYFQILTTSMLDISNLDPDVRQCFKDISLKLSQYLCQRFTAHIVDFKDYTSEKASELKQLVELYNKLPMKNKFDASVLILNNLIAAEILYAGNICEPTWRELHQAASRDNSEGLKVILKYFKGNIDERGDNQILPDRLEFGWTALIHAVYYNRRECVELLLAAGADTSKSAFIRSLADELTVGLIASRLGHSKIEHILNEVDKQKNPPRPGLCVLM